MLDGTVLGIVQVSVFERTVVDHLVNLVVKLELVSLQLVARQDRNDVVLADKLEDFFRHLKVALNVV